MREVTSQEYSLETVQRLVQGIPFFNEIIKIDIAQFERLMQLSRVVEADAGELVIHKGDHDTYLYFLLRGQLEVFPEDDSPEDHALNEISPGNVFGVLSMLRGSERTASIKVKRSDKESLLMVLDYKHFSNLDDVNTLTLGTKIAFYRMLGHNIRWMLEMNKMREPQNPLVAEMRKIKLYSGPKGVQEELVSLSEQAHGLANVLCRWNEETVPS